MILTFTPARDDVTSLQEVSLEDASEALAQHETGEKDGLAFIPARFKPCADTCAGAGRVDCGGGAQHRLNQNVAAMTGFGVDLDDLTLDGAVQALQRVQALGVECFWWTTHSHTPERPKLRLLFPFAEELALTSPARWSKEHWPALVAWLGLAADQSAKDSCRVYFLPRHPAGAQDFDTGRFEGPRLQWRNILGDVSNDAAPIAIVARPDAPSSPVHIDLDAIKARLRGMQDRSGAIKNFLAGRDVTHPHTKGHHGAWLEVTVALAHAVDDSLPSEALLPLVRKSYAQQLVDSPNSKASIDVIEAMLDSARIKVAEIRASKARTTDILKSAIQRALAPKAKAATASEPETPAEEEDEDPAPFQVPEDWQSALEMDFTDPENPKPKTTIYNITLVLLCDERYSGRLRRDEFLDVRLYGNQELKDTDVTWIAAELERQPYRFKASTQKVRECIEAVCEAQRFDSLRERFKSLRGKWDGTPRLESALVNYFGCEDTPHHRAVGKRTLIAGAARALQPGCKVDTVLIFEDPRQGTQKSKALGILGGKFFTDAFVDITNKDGWAKCSTSHIVEFGELNAMTKRDVNSLKQFLTQREDRFRPPYGRQSVTRQRRCLFFGTTNEAEYLVDDTGNRRFWIARCGDVNLKALRGDVDQLWAEAVHVFEGAKKCAECRERGSEDRCDAHRWWLSREEAKAAEQVAEERLPTNLLAEHMERALREAPPTQKKKIMKGVDLVKLMELDPSRVNSRDVARAARQIGLGKSTVREGIRGYLIPDSFLNAREGSITARIAEARMPREASA